jgi:hypothetical protein
MLRAPAYVNAEARDIRAAGGIPRRLIRLPLMRSAFARIALERPTASATLA